MTDRSNHPGERPLTDKARQWQRHLWVAAKRSPERRFHALLDRIDRRDVLGEAWRRVQKNRGAAGVDRETLACVEQYGLARMLDELHVALRAGTYRPQPVLRRYLPKADGRQRPLGIPTIRDRVAQMATTIVLEPIFEADFRRSSYRFRPRRSATQALETLRVQGARGGNHVLDADIRDYFGSIDHDKLLKLVARRISDRRVLKLLRPSKPSDSIACAERFNIRRLRNAATSTTTGKPCAGNPHARFERGSYSHPVSSADERQIGSTSAPQDQLPPMSSSTAPTPPNRVVCAGGTA